MATPRLIAPEALAGRLGDPDVALLEVAREDDDGPFREQHIPGARWTYWKDLLWHETDRRFADPETIAARLGALGIPGGATLVLVGHPIQFASYALWVMSMRGQGDLLLLDGGRLAWLSRGLPTESGAAAAAAPLRRDAGAADDAPSISRDGVLAVLGDGTHAIIDMRSPEEYSGERVSPYTKGFDHGAERKGRIPGARHLFYKDLLHDDETFRDADELRAAFARVGVDEETPVITYCRLSHRGSLGWFALTELLGHRNARVYDGSWTEWGSIVGVPIER